MRIEMIKLWTFVLCVVCIMCRCHCDIFVSPVNDHLEIEDEFRDVPATFGAVLPSVGLRGLVVLGEPENGCSDLKPPPSNTHNTTGMKWIVVLARYDCKFEIKVRKAQLAGYDAAIVHNVNSSDLERMSAKNAADVTIPSVFVSDTAGYMLGQFYDHNHGFFVVINGDMPFNINTHLLLPFAIVVGLCLIFMIIFMIVKCIKDRQRARRHRLPNRCLKKIPTCKFCKGDPYDTCAICLDDYLEGDKLRVLPCAHAYHCKCIDPWLTKNRRVCPVCKRRVFAAGETRRIERNTHNEPRSDSDSDEGHADDRTPLVRPSNAPPTQGGTFERQRENPFVRAARAILPHTRFGRTQNTTNEEVTSTEATLVQPAVPQGVPEPSVMAAGRAGEDVVEHIAEGGQKQRSAPFLRGRLNIQDQLLRGESPVLSTPDQNDTAPLISAPTSSTFLQNERQELKRQSKKSKKSRTRASSEGPNTTEEKIKKKSSKSSNNQTKLVLGEHSINTEGENEEEPRIGVAALPVPRVMDTTPTTSRNNDFVI